jgi:hypothetical protein
LVRTKKKLFAIILSLALILAMLPGSLFAAAGDPAVAGTVTLYFGDPAYTPVPPESLMDFVLTSQSGNTYTYDANYTGTDANNYYPDELLLVIKPTTSGDTLTVTVSGTSNVTYDQPSGTNGVYDIQIGNATTPSISFTAAAGGTTQTITITFHTPKDIHTGSSNLYAYFPAPGQYTNEGITTGGWGDALDSSGALKFGGDPTGTGISLGAFGGYAVFDFGDNGITNDPNNKYGADFIVYGNAFWGNSEAGGIQVSNDRVTWYEIAGSRYYNDTTVRNYSVTYTIPTPTNAAQNTGTTIPVSPSSRIDVPYTSTLGSGTITTNAYHNHSWYPFNANYVLDRGTAFHDPTKNNRLPFVSYTYTQATGDSSLTLTGVMNPTITAPTPTPVPTDTNQYQFGYADVHPNQSANFTTPYNPYIYNATSTAYNTTVSGTGGGDPIDISWAVNADGSPADLGSIRYVRIYTAEMYVSPSLGEISTEVLGVKKVDVTGSGTTTAAPDITVGGNTLADLVSSEAATVTTVGNVTYYDASDYSAIYFETDATVSASAPTGTAVYINSSTSGSVDIDFSAEAQFARIIAKDATTGNPSITLIKLA